MGGDSAIMKVKVVVLFINMKVCLFSGCPSGEGQGEDNIILLVYNTICLNNT